MLKVTFCAYDSPGAVGGPASWIQRLLPALRTQGVESRCLLLTWGESGPAAAALQEQGFDCSSVRCEGSTEDRIRWILERLRENPPDVFVPNLVVPGFFAARWAREAGIPTVGVLHSDDDFYRSLQSEFVFGEKDFSISAVVCVSRELERQVESRQPRHTIVRRIAYGVPIASRSVERIAGPLRLAYAGRLVEEQKRISEVTRAFCRVVNEVPNTEAVLFGDGPDRAAVEKILAACGNPRARLAGRVDSNRIQEQLRECHVIVLLSDYEGLPIALMEAMACGCVPVCLRMRSGIPELVEDGATGLLVNDRGDDFVKAIRRLQNEPDLWEKLSHAARVKVQSQYSNESCAKNWAALLRDLHLQSSRRTPIRIPRRFELPPVNAALQAEDHRAPAPPSVPVRIYRKSRKMAGKIKNHLRGLASGIV